jgi:thiol-disulfide isomerase/thioredoxin
MTSTYIDKNYIIIGIVILILLLCSSSIMIYSQNYSETFICKNNSEEEYINNNNQIIEIVLYYADWCGYSKMFLPIWEKFEEYGKKNFPDLKITRIKCENEKLNYCMQKGIKGYPTVKIYKNDKEIEFTEQRNLDSLINFVKQHHK